MKSLLRVHFCYSFLLYRTIIFSGLMMTFKSSSIRNIIYSVFKFILVVFSLLIATLFAISVIAFYDKIGLLKSFIIIIVSVVFILNALSIFLIQSRPKVIILPMICFACYGVFEFFYVGSGIYNDTHNLVSNLHWAILFVLRSIIPLLLSAGCYVSYKNAMDLTGSQAKSR